MPAVLPAARSRTEEFDDLVCAAVDLLESRYQRTIDGVEFAVEDVPPSTPAPWETGAVPLGRYFPANLGMPHRIVLYRRPLLARAEDPHSQLELVLHVLTEQLAHVTGWRPEA